MSLQNVIDVVRIEVWQFSRIQAHYYGQEQHYLITTLISLVYGNFS